MIQEAIKQLSSSQGVGQRQVTLGSVVVELPNELAGKRPVVVLLHLRVQLLHPPDLDEEPREVPLHLPEDPPLHAVPESPAAVASPQLVDGFQVRFRDELDLREEHVPSLLRWFAGQHDEEAAGLLVCLPEIGGGEVAPEVVEGRGGGGGGGCCCGGGGV
ncbi:hypothetical protein TorRG33x02_155870 [Trema orientale]|uniref:Uncharacterized protein n=1 Tax=Trema orientale TaxID=63057 RepID=A0A2P5ESZ6_TREOI|nr:hypothetical protein TorRG33x02_155870 [Trema orientale]